MGLLKQNVFLVGFMGVGKTTVGRRLARDLGVPFIDVDAYLHRKHGRDATSLFKQRGESGLRRAEAKALAECADMGPAVISCGEGIVASDRARELLRTRGSAIWLESSAEASLARIRNLRTRPLLAQGCDTDKLWEARRPLYEEVSVARVCVADISTGQAARAIEDVLKESGVYVASEHGETSGERPPRKPAGARQGGVQGKSQKPGGPCKRNGQGKKPPSKQHAACQGSKSEQGESGKEQGVQKPHAAHRRRRRRRKKNGTHNQQGKAQA